MARITKSFLCLSMCFILLLSMTGCPNPIDMKRAPENFPNSEWSTPNNEIVLSVKEEHIKYFEGTDKTYQGALVEVSPLTTAITGEINIGNITYVCFVNSHPASYGMSLISKSIPPISEKGAYSETLLQYTLVSFSLDYKTKKHFVARVDYGELFETGTVFDFYRKQT